MRIKREIKKRDGKKNQVKELKAKKANTNICNAVARALAYGTPVVPSSPSSFATSNYATSNYKCDRIPKHCMQTYIQTSEVPNVST